MIILNQDKNRTSENMEISVCPIYRDETTENIVGWSLENDYMELGKYKSEERCKEVLMEILNFYNKTERSKIATISKGIIYLEQKIYYEMPKE